MERPFVFPPLHTHTQDLKLSLKQYSTNGQFSSKLVVSKYQKNKEQANIEQQWNVFFTTLPGKGLIYSFLKQNLAHLQLINLKISASYNQTLRQILVLCKFEKSGKCSLSLKLEQRVCWIGEFSHYLQFQLLCWLVWEPGGWKIYANRDFQAAQRWHLRSDFAQRNE